MKKFLLIALLLSGLMTSAQTTTTNKNCKAQFKYAVNDKIMSPVAATAINFYDRSEGNVTAWFWDFGDGNTSQEQNPTNIFIHPVPGPTTKFSPYRKVSLTVLTSDTCKSLYSETINVMDGSIYMTPVCKAGFKYYQMAFDSIVGTASFQMTNLSEGDSLSYFWKFDNGQTSTEKEPIVTFDIKPADHQVCLTVTGKNNCTDTFCNVVSFTNPNKPVIYPAECYTAFGYQVNYKIQTFAPALVLDFYSKAMPETTEWTWNFDDGTTSNEQNPTHIFNFPIVKDNPNPFRKVCLTVKTASGCVAAWCETINIYMSVTPPVEPAQQCHATFKYYRPTDVISIPEVIPYQLIDVSEGNVVSRLWQFEDGTYSLDAKPLVNFNFMKPTQKICLTIYTADSCTSTWCETIFVSEIKPDTSTVPKPASIYTMRYESSFPIQMSSCAGWAKAQVYLKDSLVKADNYVWSTGQQGQEVKGLCPTQTYSVKAKTPDGIIVSGTFIFNSNGTVTETPVNWWVKGLRDNPVILCTPVNKDYIIEWKLCDGTIVRSDSVPLNSINCAAKDANLILKDASGNVIYTENISLKTMATFLNPEKQELSVKLFPNPVNEVLNIQYSGNPVNELLLEIQDITGKRISIKKYYEVENGQKISLNVNSLRKGIYLCKMYANRQLIGIGKFIK